MKNKVLYFLKEKKEYLSGEEISRKLGVTRSAVWKTIKKLQEEGYEISSSTKKGYKLVTAPNVITEDEISEGLSTKTMGRSIIYCEKVDSTNNEAKRRARLGAEEGTLIVADQQLNGKGRLGRVWNSPPMEGVWMSLILRPCILPSEASQITLIAGLALCESIRKVTGLDANIKWPNDVVVGGKKVCGILTEMGAEVERVDYVIVGIGINVNMTSFPKELPYASSLAIEGGKEYPRKQFISEFLKIFEEDYKKYTVCPNLAFVKERYERNCITLNKTVKLITRDKEEIAKAIEISDKGELIVMLEDGTKKAVSSGEVSVRGLYGYI